AVRVRRRAHARGCGAVRAIHDAEGREPGISRESGKRDRSLDAEARAMAQARLTPRRVFVTGGTGYIGRPLIRELLARGHAVRALVRAGSERKLPEGAVAAIGDALGDFAALVPPSDTLVHLVGTPHPGPHKAREFRSVDLASIRAAVAAATRAGVRHLVYVSVAHPAPA